MKSFAQLAVITCSSLLTAVVPVLAHHSFAAEYDSKKTVTIKGTVQKLEWVNPHAYFWIDTKDDSGKPVTYAFETLSPNALARQGWHRNSLKPGEEVTVEGYLARDGKFLNDGSIHANSRSVLRSDGRKVFVGSSLGDEPAAPAAK